MYQVHGYFGAGFYQVVLPKLFHFLEEKYSLALRKLGSSPCLVEAVIFMECKEAPATKVVACPVAGLQETR